LSKLSGNDGHGDSLSISEMHLAKSGWFSWLFYFSGKVGSCSDLATFAMH
jgi:hypothetical protein